MVWIMKSISPKVLGFWTMHGSILWTRRSMSGGGTLPVHSTVPKFQRQIAIVNQKTFTFILPQTYFVVKNGIVIDKDITYTSIINGPNVIFTIPSTKTGDVIKIISLDY